jgi:anti-sigma regulatory factor (Ser/Thr protein kinase)
VSRAIEPAIKFVLSASATTPGVVRTEIRHWLDRLSCPADEANQIIFCASEVVTNIVEHAYIYGHGPNGDRSVQISMRREVVADPELMRRLCWICIDIHDAGRWREPDPRRPGIGLPLLRQLLNNVVVITRGTPDYGTTVSLRSHVIELDVAQARIPRS